MKKLFLLSFIFLLVSCETEIDYEIPNPGDRIVVDASFESGRVASLYLSQSVYSMSNSFPFTRNDFDVRLQPNDTNIPLVLTTIKESDFEPKYVYRSFELLKANTIYTLTVKDSVLPEVNVSVRIPEEPVIRNISYDRESHDLEFEIEDQGETQNYYMITVEELSANRVYFSSLDPALEFLEFDIFIGDDFDGRYFGDRSFITDESFNGKKRKFSIRVDNFGQLDEGDPFNLRVHNISESYYRHEITKAAYFESDGFFNEPVQIHSNINGGYGIVRTSSSSIQTLTY